MGLSISKYSCELMRDISFSSVACFRGIYDTYCCQDVDPSNDLILLIFFAALRKQGRINLL